MFLFQNQMLIKRTILTALTAAGGDEVWFKPLEYATLENLITSSVLELQKKDGMPGIQTWIL